jgi:CubicO group peptidase (beta-lactamase class C family)
MTFPLRFSLILLGLTVLSPKSFCENLELWQAKAQSGVESLQRSELWVGGATGIYYEGQSSVVFSGATGPTETQRPSSISVFEIGSLSKSFTGILLAKIIAEHPDLSIDDSVAKFLPQLSGSFAGRITLRQLATHTSGLPRLPCTNPLISYCMNPHDSKNPYADYGAAQLIGYLKVFSRPDTGPYPREYSNTGFALLGDILTVVEKKSFDTLLSLRITGPLEMTDTKIQRVSEIPSPHLLNGYEIDRSLATHWDWDVFAPTGGVTSTAADMMKYLSANVHPPQTALGQAIRQSQTLGLGWDSPPGGKLLWKNGQTAGFHSIMVVNPKNQTGIFVLSNIGSMYADAVATMPFNVPMPDLIGPKLTSKALDSFLGTYACPKENKTFQITKPASFLFLKTEGLKLRLRPVDDSTFNAYDAVNPDGFHKAVFKKSTTGEITSMTLSLNNGQAITELECQKK